MAAELETPGDWVTGLPYAILPFENAREIDPNHVAHPSDEPRLQGIGGWAVRHARVQDLAIPDHVKYHQIYRRPVWLPETPSEQFSYGVWAALNYIPQYAIDLSKKTPSVVRMNDEQLTRLRAGEIRVGSNEILGTFFSNYVRQQSLHHVNDTLIDEFLHTPDRERRQVLGAWLLNEAAEVATDPLREKFFEAKKKGMIAVERQVNLPSVVCSKIGKNKKQDFIRKLRIQLAA